MLDCLRQEVRYAGRKHHFIGCKAGQPLTLKELSERCGFPKSTVFGLLTTMREYDVISQTPDGKYTLGLRLF